jgi:transcriptional regulator with XRE-family HTH domain
MKKEKIKDAVKILQKRYVKNDPSREVSIEEERINSHVARMIYALRKEKDMTQTELAKEINTTQSVISRLEDSDYNGHSLAMLQKICIALGRKINIAVDGDEFSCGSLELQQLKQENEYLKQENKELKETMLEEIKIIQVKVDDVANEMIEQRMSSQSGSIQSEGDTRSRYDTFNERKVKLVS